MYGAVEVKRIPGGSLSEHQCPVPGEVKVRTLIRVMGLTSPPRIVRRDRIGSSVTDCLRVPRNQMTAATRRSNGKIQHASLQATRGRASIDSRSSCRLPVGLYADYTRLIGAYVAPGTICRVVQDTPNLQSWTRMPRDGSTGLVHFLQSSHRVHGRPSARTL